MLIRDLDLREILSMKRLGFVFVLLFTTVFLAATDKPNPADFTVQVHVISSGSFEVCGGGSCTNFQVLETVIDNQPVELQSGAGGVLKLGDYPARLVASWREPKHPNN
jgi:hypothetical protein